MQNTNKWATDIKTTYKYFLSWDDNLRFYSPPIYLK